MPSKTNKKHQKELKRKQLKKQRKLVELTYDQYSALQASLFPINECIVPDNLFELGIGHLSISRTLPNGKLAFAKFLLDVFCLGVKDISYSVLAPHEYHDNIVIMKNISEYSTVSPAYFKTLIVQAVDYANKLDLAPHKNYSKVIKILKDINCDDSKFNFGKDGKPFYFRGPNESWKQAEQIIHHLEKKLGKDNYMTAIEK